jgi:hypothetical protein
MKKLIILLTLAFIPWLAVPGDCFIDYLFGGSATSDAIGNNVVGDLRSWWSGNPVYNFNPYYSGGNQPGQNNQGTAGGQNQGAPPQAYNQQNQQPSVTYYPPQGQQYNYNQGQQQPMQQQYQAAPQPYQMQQQAPPQAYYQQGSQQQYQGPPQGYEQVPQQQYQGPPQGYEQGPQQYQQAPRGGGYQSYQYEQETPQNE